MSLLANLKAVRVALAALRATAVPPPAPASGRTFEAEAVAERVTAGATRGARGTTEPKAMIGTLPVWQQLESISRPLTPVSVSDAFRQADRGDMQALCDLGNHLRQRDLHLQSILGTNEEGISGLSWDIVPPDDAGAREKKAAKYIESALRDCAGFTTMLAHQAGALYPGYAVAETLAKKWNGRLVPVDFKCHAQRRFRYGEQDGRLYWYDKNGTMTLPGVDFRAKWPGRFIVSEPRVNGDVRCREGLARPLIWAALFRNWTLSDWLKLGEMAWKPWRWVEYDSKVVEGEAGVDRLMRVLEDMIASGVAALPKDHTMHIEWPKNTVGSGGNSQHKELFATMGSEMSKGVLGQTETTEASKSSGYAQAKVHNQIRVDLRQSRSKWLATDVTRDVVQVFTAMNYGPGVRAGRMRMFADDPTDLATFATGIKTLVDAGTRVPAVWTRKEAGIPDPQKDEEILAPAKAPPPEPEKPKPDGGEPGPGPADGDPADPADDPPAKAA